MFSLKNQEKEYGKLTNSLKTQKLIVDLPDKETKELSSTILQTTKTSISESDVTVLPKSKKQGTEELLEEKHKTEEEMEQPQQNKRDEENLLLQKKFHKSLEDIQLQVEESATLLNELKKLKIKNDTRVATKAQKHHKHKTRYVKLETRVKILEKKQKQNICDEINQNERTETKTQKSGISFTGACLTALSIIIPFGCSALYCYIQYASQDMKELK
ncbi:hypothetical protein AB837_00307 [bacterium AB1]|nr:hypothetical protein AB837_00307 [bacterium AB1]